MLSYKVGKLTKNWRWVSLSLVGLDLKPMNTYFKSVHNMTHLDKRCGTQKWALGTHFVEWLQICKELQNLSTKPHWTEDIDMHDDGNKKEKTKNYEKMILRHCDLDFWPKVTNLVSYYLTKTTFKSVRLEFCSLTDRQTNRQTDTQTNCNESVTPPRFRGGVKSWHPSEQNYFPTNGAFPVVVLKLNGSLVD